MRKHHELYTIRIVRKYCNLLVKPLRQAGLDSVEIVELLFRSLQTELATPVCKHPSLVQVVFDGIVIIVVFGLTFVP